MLNVNSLVTSFDVGKETITVLEGVSLQVNEGSTVGLVGESGSGKSVIALSILRLLANNGRVDSGDIYWNNRSVLNCSEKEMRSIRGGEIGLIFQNPLAALNPVFTIGQQFCETLRLHQQLSKDEAVQKTIEWLKKVNISDPENRIHDYPHQFSLGMCQRIMIALAACTEPHLLIADEPTASLDVTIQAQILALLNNIQSSTNMGILLISHDLGVIAQHCDYIYVMYLGKIVESGSPEQVFCSPKHPYTKALISSIPVPDPTIKHVPTLLKGDVPNLRDLPPGCRFHPRCPSVQPDCSLRQPKLEPIEGGEMACFYPNRVGLSENKN